MKKSVFYFFTFWGIFHALITQAQEEDSIRLLELAPVTIQGYRFQLHTVKPLEKISGTYIHSGKKSEVITVYGLPANLTEKTGRQIFAKIPGAFIYDMDGSGNQVNIATRGLDPHRSWEYNIRQNDIITNSDIYGYPASHYSPPMEAIQKIEITRGTASLQYGSQFGGMINYITKIADTTRSFGLETINSAGSFGLLSSYNAIGGRIGKLTYYAYYQRRVSNGYRENARSEAQAQFVSLDYSFSKKISLKAEIGRSKYLYQIPGPLTDVMFDENPRQSTRIRNYFNPDIYIPSLTVHWQMGERTKLNWINSAVLGHRSSVQFIAFANELDMVESGTLQHKPRQVDIDNFHSYASELRLRHDFRFVGNLATLSAGVRYVNNDLHRRQQGLGTTGVSYELDLISPDFGRDLHFRTKNISLFLEQLIPVHEKLDISLGTRIENGVSRMSGFISYLPNDSVRRKIEHKYPLFGINFQYRLNKNNSLYGGWSQAYRPVIFADLIPATILEKTNDGIRDAFGHNAEIGIRGILWERISYDLSLFQLLYMNRIGTLVQQDNLNQPYIWKTNIGDSKTKGMELYFEYPVSESIKHKISLFTSTSYFDGFYIRGKLRNGNENTDLKGNRLETVPEWISRNGLQVAYKNFSGSLQWSFVSESYSDAVNTRTPLPNGSAGLVPSYHIWDLNLAYRIRGNILLRVSLNNLMDQQYFTKRPAGYPGPGVWSSDGRSLVVSVATRL